MRGKRAIGTAALALALAAGIAGPAQAVNSSAAPAVKDVPGIVTVTETGTADGKLVMACCPAGKTATGGGVRTDGKATVLDTYPTDDGNGWLGAAKTSDGSTPPITVYVRCA